jgi:tRNA (guanine37-N1)-methyltransferase
MRIDVITLFPEAFAFLRDAGVSGRAHSQNLWSLHTCNPRSFVLDHHRTIDDRPFGGGPGMVMMAEPLSKAIEHTQQQRISAQYGADQTQTQTQSKSSLDQAFNQSLSINSSTSSEAKTPVILLSPAGRRFDQACAQQLADSTGAIFICGRYEGVDQRLIDRVVDDQWSLGDFVLSGGEPAAVAMIDAAVRLIPGVLGHQDSCSQDSFQSTLSGLLDAPHYTRPEVLDGESVPEVLLSGHHANIAKWRRQQSLLLSAKVRPDLILQARTQGLLTKADEVFLTTISQN